MSLSSLSVAQVRHLLSLTEKREAVQAELAKVESQIAVLEKEKEKVEASRKVIAKAPVKKAAVVVKAKPAAKSNGRRGGLKDRILALLEKAGSRGATVVDIADTLGVKVGNIHVWFATTGKKMSNVIKIKPGLYGLKGA
jgi:hypothetical protein